MNAVFRRRYTAFLALAIAAVHGFQAMPGYAAPSGGVVTAGDGTITRSGADTTISQDSARLAIDWDSFNVAADERVRFVQPDDTAVALNRILDNSPTQIMGRIDANGRVILTNPNGLIFGEGASINVGSLIASGLEIDPSDFINGDLLFSAANGGDGLVVNRGLINAATGGNVALLGQQVENHGLISAHLGSVSLAAGTGMVATFDEQGLLGVRVTEASLSEQVAVENHGEISAKGGHILLNASTSADLFSRAVNRGTLDSGNHVIVHDDGSFTLGAGAGVVNTGVLDASSPDGAGGEIAVLGDAIRLSDTSQVLANSVGDAGHIHVQATQSADVAGELATRSASEAGGLINIASADTLNYRATADRTSADFRNGVLVLQAQDIALTGASGGVRGAAIETALQTGSVIIRAHNRIESSADNRFRVEVSDHENFSSLILDAGYGIQLSGADLLLGGGHLALVAGTSALCADCTQPANGGSNRSGINIRQSALGTVGDLHLYSYNGISLLDVRLPDSPDDFAPRSLNSLTAQARDSIILSASDDFSVRNDIQLVIAPDTQVPALTLSGDYALPPATLRTPQQVTAATIALRKANSSDLLKVDLGGDFRLQADAFHADIVSQAALQHLWLDNGSANRAQPAQIYIEADTIGTVPRIGTADQEGPLSPVDVSLVARHSDITHRHDVITGSGNYSASADGAVEFLEGRGLDTVTTDGSRQTRAGQVNIAADRNPEAQRLSNINIKSAGDVDIDSASGFNIAGLNAANLLIKTIGEISQTGPISITGNTHFNTGVGGTINLIHADNDFNRLTMETGYVSNITLADRNTLTLGELQLGDSNIDLRAQALIQDTDAPWQVYDTWLLLNADRLELGAAGSSPIHIGTATLAIEFADSLDMDGQLSAGLFDVISIKGTGDNNRFTVGPNAEFDLEQPEWSDSIIHLGAGDDVVNLHSTVLLPITLGEGNDTVNINGSNLDYNVIDFDETADTINTTESP